MTSTENTDGCMKWSGAAILAAALMWAASTAWSYEQPYPRYIVVDLTWKDARTGTVRTDRGQLWFRDLPHVDASGKTRGFGRYGCFNGIKWFVPKEPGAIWMRREEQDTNPATFFVHDHYGEEAVVLAFSRIDVKRTDKTKKDLLMIESSEAVIDTGESFIDEDTGLDALLKTAKEESAEPAKRKKKEVVPPDEKPSPVLFATDESIGATRIPVTNVQKVVFLNASDGLQRERYVGRFVQFSNAAKGDEGRVQVKTATYFGGPDGAEHFGFGSFLSDDRILLAGNYTNVDFTAGHGLKIECIGSDPPAAAYPRVEQADRRGRKRVSYPRRTPVVFIFNKELTRVERGIRLPWGTGEMGWMAVGLDDTTHMVSSVGPHFDALAAECRRVNVVEYPEAAAAAKEKKREPRGDSFVLKFAPGWRSIAWIVRFKHSWADIFARPDGKLLVVRDRKLFFIDPDGAVSDGPDLDITGSKVDVDCRTGDMYFGGSYRSGTGLEPYVNPYLYKVNADGKQVWTAYGWSGPIVGVEQSRLVADSSVTRIRVSEDGSLTVTGWSDGGNTVLSHQPFDLRREAPSSGFCSSLWGATGGLTVRIAHIIHMDQNTMEVDHCTKYVSYLPPSDVPTLINIYDYARTGRGEVALTGGSWTGYVETHDAWVKPWYIEYQTNEFAQAKGGTFFTLFRSDFSTPRMCTRTPGVSGGKLATKGKMVLLYCGATDSRRPTDPRWKRATHDPIVVRAMQPRNAGGLDGYAMLIDTDGPPNPPVIPKRTWGVLPKRKGR